MERGSFRAAAAAAAAFVLAALCAVAPAHAYVYWADTQAQTIGRAANDGSHLEPGFVHTGALPSAVAVDSAHVYWANRDGNSIGRANIDGSGVDNSFIAGVAEPTGVAVNGSSIFWSSLKGPIGRANLDGTNKKNEFFTGVAESCGVALDSGHVYWTDIASGVPAFIGRGSLDGGEKKTEFVKIPIAVPCGIAVNSSNVFWSDTGLFGGGTRIGRANVTSGEGVDSSFIGDASTPCGMAVSGTTLYWANAETSSIARANTDGTAVDESFIPVGGGALCGVAVDSLSPPSGSAPGPLPGQVPIQAPADRTPPETKIVAGPGAKLGSGRATFRFSSTEAGSTFECSLDRARPRRCSSPKRFRGLGPGRHRFRAWATDAAGNRDPTPAKRSFRVPR